METNQEWGLKNYIKLFACLFKIGLFTIGGGLVMLPIIQREFVEKQKWVDEEKITDIFAVAQALPGVIAINTSIYIGYELGGLPGAVTAAAGVTLPSFLCILIVFFTLSGVGNNIYLARFYMGVRSAVVALIALAVLKLGKSAVKDKFGVCVAVFGILASVFLRLDIAVVVIISGFLGYTYYCFYPVIKEREKR